MGKHATQLQSLEHIPSGWKVKIGDSIGGKFISEISKQYTTITFQDASGFQVAYMEADGSGWLYVMKYGV